MYIFIYIYYICDVVIQVHVCDVVISMYVCGVMIMYMYICGVLMHTHVMCDIVISMLLGGGACFLHTCYEGLRLFGGDMLLLIKTCITLTAPVCVDAV